MQPADVNAWFRLFSIAVHQARPELALRLLDNVCAVMAQISRDQKARSSTLNALEYVAFWLGGEAGYGARVHDAWLAVTRRFNRRLAPYARHCLGLLPRAEAGVLGRVRAGV